MNYEDMSDFEIKRAVANAALWARRDCDEIYCNPETGECRWADGARWHNFDPINNPSDAWPIIVKNDITLFSPDYNKGDNDWRAEIYDSDEGIFDFTCVNPLRAAMIVFLMVQEAKRG